MLLFAFLVTLLSTSVYASDNEKEIQEEATTYLNYEQNWEQDDYLRNNLNEFEGNQNLKNFLDVEYKEFVGKLQELSGIADIKLLDKINGIENKNLVDKGLMVLVAIRELAMELKEISGEPKEKIEDYIKSDLMKKSDFTRAMVMRFARSIENAIDAMAVNKENTNEFYDMFVNAVGRQETLDQKAMKYLSYIYNWEHDIMKHNAARILIHIPYFKKFLMDKYIGFVKQLAESAEIKENEIDEGIKGIEKAGIDDSGDLDDSVIVALRVIDNKWINLPQVNKENIEQKFKQSMKENNFEGAIAWRFARAAKVQSNGQFDKGGVFDMFFRASAEYARIENEVKETATTYLNYETNWEKAMYFFNVIVHEFEADENLHIFLDVEYTHFVGKLQGLTEIPDIQLLAEIADMNTHLVNMGIKVYNAIQKLANNWKKISGAGKVNIENYIKQLMETSDFIQAMVKRFARRIEMELEKIPDEEKNNEFLEMFMNAAGVSEPKDQKAIKYLSYVDNSECQYMEDKSAQMMITVYPKFKQFLMNKYKDFIKELTDLPGIEIIDLEKEIKGIEEAESDDLEKTVITVLMLIDEQWINVLKDKRESIEKKFEQSIKDNNLEGAIADRFARVLPDGVNRFKKDGFFELLRRVSGVDAKIREVATAYLNYEHSWGQEVHFLSQFDIFNNNLNLHYFFNGEYREFVGKLQELSLKPDIKLRDIIDGIENMNLVSKGLRVLGAIKDLANNYWADISPEAKQKIEDYINQLMFTSDFTKAMIKRFARSIEAENGPEHETSDLLNKFVNIVGSQEPFTRMAATYLSYIDNWNYEMQDKSHLARNTIRTYKNFKQFLMDKYLDLFKKLTILSGIREDDRIVGEKIQDIKNADPGDLDDAVVEAFRVIDKQWVNVPPDIRALIERDFELSQQMRNLKGAISRRFARTVPDGNNHRFKEQGFFQMLRRASGGIRQHYFPRFGEEFQYQYLKFVLSFVHLLKLDLPTDVNESERIYFDPLNSFQTAVFSEEPCKNDIQIAGEKFFDSLHKIWIDNIKNKHRPCTQILDEYLQEIDKEHEVYFPWLKNLLEKENRKECRDGFYKYIRLFTNDDEKKIEEVATKYLNYEQDWRYAFYLKSIREKFDNDENLHKFLDCEYKELVGKLQELSEKSDLKMLDKINNIEKVDLVSKGLMVFNAINELAFNWSDITPGAIKSIEDYINQLMFTSDFTEAMIKRFARSIEVSLEMIPEDAKNVFLGMFVDIAGGPEPKEQKAITYLSYIDNWEYQELRDKSAYIMILIYPKFKEFLMNEYIDFIMELRDLPGIRPDKRLIIDKKIQGIKNAEPVNMDYAVIEAFKVIDKQWENVLQDKREIFEQNIKQSIEMRNLKGAIARRFARAVPDDDNNRFEEKGVFKMLRRASGGMSELFMPNIIEEFEYQYLKFVISFDNLLKLHLPQDEDEREKIYFGPLRSFQTAVFSEEPCENDIQKAGENFFDSLHKIWKDNIKNKHPPCTQILDEYFKGVDKENAVYINWLKNLLEIKKKKECNEKGFYNYIKKVMFPSTNGCGWLNKFNRSYWFKQ